eukprot:CAMPEP_0178424218 /NCGR_PEP_ID=MMETSP0689_2-20121128/28096_1 /TAXON_ID=160604 /ORGANISM="Amphidinium massartii, Strain CS-259" /LENGTH=202 /DNA_ID=CAMNT_0020045847 /DNA_START=97 /DNA_END=702 /DNA_ORIENTATION=-
MALGHPCAFFSFLLMLSVFAVMISSVVLPWWTEVNSGDGGVVYIEMSLWYYKRTNDPDALDIDQTINEICDQGGVDSSIEGEIDDQCAELQTIQTLGIVGVIAAFVSAIAVLVAAIMESCESWTRFLASIAAAVCNVCALLAIILAGQVDVSEGFLSGNDVELDGNGFNCMIAVMLISLLGVALPCFAKRGDQTPVVDMDGI